MSAIESPALGSSWRSLSLIRLFSSLTFGITLLVLIVAYACVFSALPQVRVALEVTEMQAFSHWLFVTLNVLLCLSVVIATLTRIRFNLINLGVWIVHAGLLTLSIGAMAYFGAKIEGDVLLRSPRIELVGTQAGGDRVLAALLPRKGESWASQMPAFGGGIRLDVVETRGNANRPVQSVSVRVQRGDAPPTDLVLSDSDPSVQPIAERLGIRLQIFEPQRKFYDNHVAALYFRPVGQASAKAFELTGLPSYRERYLDEGYTLIDRGGLPVPSKRTTPAIRLAGLSIPTGWFESWRLPIHLVSQELPFSIEVTGFAPYVSGMRRIAAGGGDADFPGMNLLLEAPDRSASLERSLFAASPVDSFVALSTPVEFRWVENAAERDALLSPMAGPAELVIESADPPARKTIAVREGETYELEGTSYKLTVQQVFPTWPLMSPGFESAASPAALVAVTSDQKSYTRTVIQRYPQLSQDIDEKGMRKRDGLYDPNLTLRFRNAQNGYILVIADPQSAAAGEATVATFDPAGHVQVSQARVGERQRILFGMVPADLTVRELFTRSRKFDVPVVEPRETRRANLAERAASAIRLSLTGKGESSNWSETHWLDFSQYPDVDQSPLIVQAPDGRAYELIYSRLQHDLGAALTPERLTVKFFPGRRSVESWRSYFLAQNDGEASPQEATVYTNATYALKHWTLFQSGAANDHWSYTILGVGNRIGIGPMLTGCSMITLGCLYAFYVKPWLRRRRAERGAAAARGRRAAESAEKEVEPELVQVR